jgi:cell wall-associated NlpC family hydrolase
LISIKKEALSEMKRRHIISVFAISIILIASAPGFAEQQTYKVGKGDTLYRISKLYNTTPEALKDLNGLKSDKISVGQVLKVPSEQPVTSAKTVQPAEPTPSAKPAAAAEKQQPRKETRTYTVRSGDTLSGIARSHSLSLKDLTAANNIKNNSTLKIGQVLTIPGRNETVVETRETTSAPAAAVVRVASQTDSKPTTNGAVELNVRDRLIEAGFNVLGVRYRFGGTSEKTGFDCSALVKYLFAKFDLTLPRSSREQYKEREKVAKEDLQKGDLVFFSSGGKTPTHVGIYIGDNQFLHAASKAKKVIISDLGKTWYDLRYIGARRILELWWEDPKRSLDDPSSEWAHQLFGEWEESQIPLNDTLPVDFTVSIQKFDTQYKGLAAAGVSD